MWDNDRGTCPSWNMNRQGRRPRQFKFNNDEFWGHYATLTPIKYESPIVAWSRLVARENEWRVKTKEKWRVGVESPSQASLAINTRTIWAGLALMCLHSTEQTKEKYNKTNYVQKMMKNVFLRVKYKYVMILIIVKLKEYPCNHQYTNISTCLH